MTAPSPNRRYQQLRAHLAYLKLDAASEALAQVLDENGDAHVEVLERFVSIEVDATSTASANPAGGWPACPPNIASPTATSPRNPHSNRS